MKNFIIFKTKSQAIIVLIGLLSAATFNLSAQAGITVTPNELNGFNYIVNSGPSSNLSFTVNGIDLTNDITIAAPVYYEISTASDAGFGSSITLTHTLGVVSDKTVYVRLKAGLYVYNFTEVITVASAGSSSKTVTCNGSVACVPSDLAFNQTLITKSLESPVFTANASSLLYTLPPVSYFSSNSNVASVAAGGVVTIGTSTGQTTISASHDAGSGLCATSTSYTLNVVQTPLLTVSPVALGGFGTVSGVLPSAEQTFTVSGSNLTDDITLTAPANYEISTTSGSAFGPSVTLNQVAGAVAGKTLYVRLKAGLPVAVYDNEAVTVASTLAASKTVVCSGGVTRAAPGLDFGAALSKALDSPNFIRLATSLNTTTTISYSGSNDNVATINPLTGEVDIIGLGEVVLTATQAAGTHNFVEYLAATSSYTLAVYQGPVVTVTTEVLSDFSYIVGAGPSAEKTFTVSGSNLTSDITLSLPTIFEISTISGSFLGTPVTLTQSEGIVAPTTIYVRLKAGLFVNSFAEAITVASVGAASKAVALSGNVNCAPSSLVFAEASITKTLDSPVYTLKATSFYITPKVSYLSSDVNVATVDTAGVVTIGTSTGQITITASHEAGNGLCAASTFYTLNVIQTPLLTVSPAALSGFGTVSGVLPSAEQIFTVSGSFLTDDITLTAPANYEISMTSGSAFGPSVTLIQSGGAVADRTIYARLKAGLPVAVYENEAVTVASDLAVFKAVVCSGSVTCAASQLAFLVTHVDKTMGNAPFSVVPTSGNGTTAIGYSSSAPSVATVNAVTGEVTLVGDGQAEITASQVAGSHNSVEYCSAADMYTLNVAVGPTITVTPSSISDFTYTAGSPAPEKSFIVSGSLLTNDITVTPPINYQISTGMGAAFIPVNQIVLARTGNVVAATTIYVRLKTEINVGSYSENISLASIDAVTKSVACSGTVLCYPYNLEFGVSVVTKAPGDAAFTEVATTLRPFEISYSSSVPVVATVNSSTGEVSILAAGSTVITASQAEGGGYCGEMDTYTLNVGVPTITVAETLIPGMSAEVGATDIETITVTGANLTADIRVAIDNPSLFVLSVENIAQIDGVVLDEPVTITYSPGVVGIHVATLTLSSTGAADVIRELSGTATSGPATGINQRSVGLIVSVVNGNLKFLAPAGEQIEVFNTIGQKLTGKLTVEGLNTISVSARGLVLIKVGNRVAKVIM